MNLDIKVLENLIRSKIANKFVGIVSFSRLKCNSNTIGIMIDGMIQIKFSYKFWNGNFVVEEVVNTRWIDLDVKLGDELTFDELSDKISNAWVYDNSNKKWNCYSPYDLNYGPELV